MGLKAKPIVKNQSWIVIDGDTKVGNVVSTGSGFQVRLGDKISTFDSTKTIKRKISIEFESAFNNKTKENLDYAIWPTVSKTYNNVFDVKRKLHLFTKTLKSRCYHVAGWFRVKMNDEWKTIFCPKYIFIQRYDYHGPFMNKTDADNS